MDFQNIEKEKKDRIRDLREQNKEAKSSSSVWHAQYTVDEDRKLANVHEMGQEQKKEESVFGGEKEKEKDKESRMQEIFHTENAFGRISLGLNEKGESVLVSARKMRADIKSTERSERELDEQRSYSSRVNGGDDKINFNKPDQSAAGFYQNDRSEVENHTQAQRFVSRSRDFSDRTGNMLTREFIPSKSSAVGETKELSAGELKLEHQLAMALERGKKKNEEKKDPAMIMIIMSNMKEEEVKSNNNSSTKRTPEEEDPGENTSEDEENGAPTDE